MSQISLIRLHNAQEAQDKRITALEAELAELRRLYKALVASDEKRVTSLAGDEDKPRKVAAR